MYCKLRDEYYFADEMEISLNMLQDFLDNSTMHGLSYLNKSKRNIVRR